MGEDKKTKLEREAEKNLAENVRKAYKERADELKKTYSMEVQKIIEETARYNGAAHLTETGKKLERFLKTEGNRPSDFFRSEMKNMPGWIPDDLLEDFYCTIDSIIKWQASQSYFRRTVRTKKYTSYMDRYFRIMAEYHDMGIYNADIVSIYKGNVPVGTLCLYKDKGANGWKAISEYWIQAELDRGNVQLEEALMDILFGESTGAKLTTEMIRGICMSENSRLHEALGKLLLAARLQEGLRQAICENMDYGTTEAFMTLFRVIKDNELLRYAAVTRAVGTWTGLVANEESKIDRIQEKQLYIIDTYLHDENARHEALMGEDAMKIYLALWCYGFFDIDDACRIMKELALNGTKHQRMVFAMYIDAMSLGKMYVHKVAKEFVERYGDEPDTMAVVMPSFMSDYQVYMNELIYEEGRRYKGKVRKKTYAEFSRYFDSMEECLRIYDILMGLLDKIPGRKLEINPCVFPWNVAYLEKSDIIMRLGVCASALRDEDKITAVVRMMGDIDPSKYCRDTLMMALIREPANDDQRALLVEAVADKETFTRQKAAELVKNMELSPENYTQLENMLKYKKADVRDTVLSILYKMDGNSMYELIGRLLADPKEEKRTAGLDLLLQLKKDEDRKELFARCVKHIDTMEHAASRVSTKEQILINEIINTGENKPDAERGYGLYDVNATYEPVFDAAYLEDCKEVYKRYFPDSGIAMGKNGGDTGKLAGAFAKLKAKLGTGKTEAVSETEEIVKKLDELIDAHKNDEYTNRIGEICMLGESGGLYSEDGNIQFAELWEGFYRENIQTPERLVQVYTYLQGCNNDREDFKKYCESFIRDMFGGPYVVEQYNYGYLSRIKTVVSYLYDKYVLITDMRKLAVVAADYLISRKAELVYDFRVISPRADREERNRVYHRGVITNEQIMKFTGYLTLAKKICFIEVEDGSDIAAANEEEFRHLFPYNYALAECYGFHVPEDVANVPGEPYYWIHAGEMMWVPTLHDYIAAYSRGIVTRDYMYKMAFEGNPLDSNLKCVSDIIRYITERDRQVQTRRNEWSWLEQRRVENIRRILLHDPSKELSEADQRIFDIAKELYEDMSGLVMEAELTRGDTETEFSRYIYGLTRIYGAEYFVRILSALGKETLERSSYFNSGYSYGGNRMKVSKKNSLSHLLQSCLPGVGDNAETLKSYLAGTDISEARLVEAAMYSPEWIDIVGEYLGWDGFAGGCYYFMAHMNESFDNKRTAMIARYTPLSVDELNDGAFDRAWFAEVYEKLGDKHFTLIYKAAKYISDGAKHTRARKYADAALGRYNEAELIAEIEAKRNKDLLMAVGILPIDNESQIRDRYMFLQKFKKESRQFGAQRRASESVAVQIALQNMAINAGYQDVTRLILRMESLVAQGMSDYFKPHDVGEVSLWLEMGDGGKCTLICEKNGKQLKSVPAKLKKDEYVVALTEAKKQMAEQARRTKAMLEDAMESEEVYTWAEIKGMLENPVISDMVAAVVFKVQGENGDCAASDDETSKTKLFNGNQREKCVLGFATLEGLNVIGAYAINVEDKNLNDKGKSLDNAEPEENTIDVDSNRLPDSMIDVGCMELPDDTKLVVAHPVHMYKAGVWHDVQKYVFARKIVQPFKQVFRELYVKTEEELGLEHSLRYAGNQIQPRKTLGCLRSRHWVADVDEGLQKVYYKENIVARIYALADWFSPSDIEAPTLEWVVFTDRRNGKDLKIKDIPDIIFSEVMRDVDMAVSVAHAGGVDPETSHSTIEMRKAIAEFTMPLFKLANVSFTRNHAIINGKRANYTVHLGSGVVHQEAGPMINVLPVHSQRRGRIFLPFVDDDPKTSEVLTKILFFAEDNKIKDPFILDQIE